MASVCANFEAYYFAQALCCHSPKITQPGGHGRLPLYAHGGAGAFSLFPLLRLPPTCSSSLPSSVDGTFAYDLQTLLAIHSLEGQEILAGRYAQQPPPRSEPHPAHDLPIRVRSEARVDGLVISAEIELLEGFVGDDPPGELQRAESVPR